jgi:hypothetical protein
MEKEELLIRLKQANRFCGMSFPVLWGANFAILLLGYWSVSFSLAMCLYAAASVFIVLRDIWILKYRLIDCPIWRFVLDHVAAVGAVVISLLLTGAKVIDGGEEILIETNFFVWVAVLALTVPALHTSRKVWKKIQELRLQPIIVDTKSI